MRMGLAQNTNSRSAAALYTACVLAGRPAVEPKRYKLIVVPGLNGYELGSGWVNNYFSHNFTYFHYEIKLKRINKSIL